MPEFHPSAVPDTVDEFTQGYLAAAEWLLPEVTDEDGNSIAPPPYDKVTGWERRSLRQATRDCRAFQKQYGDLLAEYYRLRECEPDAAGYDYFLSRNGHGSGFFDRGNESVFKALQEAARLDGEWSIEGLTRTGRIRAW